MAVIDEYWTLANARWPDVETAAVTLAYDPPTDTLFADFDCVGGQPVPAVNVPLAASDDIASLRIALDSDEIVGVEVEGFLSLAPGRYPSWLALAPYADVPLRELQARGIPATASVPRHEAVARLLEDVRAAWTADVEEERLATAGSRTV